MAKISIYLKLINGKLSYRDSEDHSGSKIETFVKPGDKITWTLDKDSGISDLTGINLVGPAGFFSKGPSKKASDKWTAKVADKIDGEVSYYMFYTPDGSQSQPEATSLKSAVTYNTTDEDPPVIKPKG